MAERDSFLNAIQKNPNDSMVRLVFADWLEERGDPHGELIRIQCKLHDWVSDREERAELQARERELLVEHYDEWLAPFDGIADCYVQFDRGLFDVTINAEPSSFPMSNWIGTLRLRNFQHIGKFFRDRLRRTTELPTLHTLDVAGITLSDREASNLVEIIEDRSLKAVLLMNCLTTDQLLDLLKSNFLSSLTRLGLDGCVSDRAWLLDWQPRQHRDSPWVQDYRTPGLGRHPDRFRNSMYMPLQRCPSGSFRMGTNEDNQERTFEKDEMAHLVSLSRDFYIGVYPVRIVDYNRVMEWDPGVQQRDIHRTDVHRPMEFVNWTDAVEFCTQLSNLPEEKLAGRKYRLPTEAEWEYACRAGSETHYALGNAWNNYFGNASGLTAASPVGNYLPNAWGLYDMHGNVREWCADWYRREYYSESSVVDPKGPEEGMQRIMRGGSWDVTSINYARSAYRVMLDPNERRQGVGFRVVCELENQFVT
jgi:uncharacterized protein (TIGR02996 family)